MITPSPVHDEPYSGMSSRPITAGVPVRPHAAAPAPEVEFRVGDMFDLDALVPKGTFRAITHGGVTEHLDSAKSIRKTLGTQLEHVPNVIFDIPFDSPKNRRLFTCDTIFRQLWTAEQWLRDVLAGLTVVKSCIELHRKDNMTDDLVVTLAR